MPAFCRYTVRSSAIFLVRVVTRTRSCPGGAGVDFPDQVVDLPLDGPHLHLRIQQPRGPNDLLYDLSGTGALVLTRSGGDIDHLIDLLRRTP